MEHIAISAGVIGYNCNYSCGHQGVSQQNMVILEETVVNRKDQI